MNDDGKMTCSYCLKRLAWPDGYPNTVYSVCWRCTWDAHFKREHPPTRRQRRTQRKRAVDQAKRKLLREYEQSRSAEVLERGILANGGDS